MGYVYIYKLYIYKNVYLYICVYEYMYKKLIK